MPTPGQGTIGSLDYPPEERKKLAKRSVTFCCEECCPGPTINLLKAREEEDKDEKAKLARAEEAKELARQMSFKVR